MILPSTPASTTTTTTCTSTSTTTTTTTTTTPTPTPTATATAPAPAAPAAAAAAHHDICIYIVDTASPPSSLRVNPRSGILITIKQGDLARITVRIQAASDFLKIVPAACARHALRDHVVQSCKQMEEPSTS